MPEEQDHELPYELPEEYTAPYEQPVYYFVPSQPVAPYDPFITASATPAPFPHSSPGTAIPRGRKSF